MKMKGMLDNSTIQKQSGNLRSRLTTRPVKNRYYSNRNNQITYEINYYSNNKQQSDNLQSKNSPHFQSDDVCIPEKWKSQLSKLMAGRMLLNLRSRARKNLHMLTTQQYWECQSQQQNIHFKSLTTTPAIGQSSLAV